MGPEKQLESIVAEDSPHQRQCTRSVPMTLNLSVEPVISVDQTNKTRRASNFQRALLD